MSKKQVGFSVFELLVVVVVVAVAVGLGYRVYKTNHNKKAPAASQVSSGTASSQQATLPAASPGTIQAIDNITTQAIDSSSSIDSKYTTNDQSTAQSTNGAASNLGGAYDESSF